PGLQNIQTPIPNPTNASVQTYLNSILEEWNKNTASEGYVNAARSSLQLTTAYSSQQAGLDLGFNAEWAGGDVSTKLGMSSSSEKSVVIAFYRQIFYSVTLDTPTSPGSVFGEDVSLDELKQIVRDDAIPAYVRSVDYGRLLMITMETSMVDTKVNLEAALNQTLNSGVKVGGSIDAKYENIVKNATFSVIAIGGGAQTAATFSGNEEDLKNLGQYLEKDATYRRDNPGAPISYAVAFLKDNTLAEMGFTTEYTETECIRYLNGFIRLKHEGWYVAKFNITWEEADEKGKFRKKSWDSGEKTAGYIHQLDLPGDARNVKIHGIAATGLAWDPWGDAINVTENGPTNKTYRIYGTTLDRQYVIK
ncbi:MAG: hypothetical protein GWO38_32780, partial [Phycisphaerae bacterium]|nr:hypothetical protein [Phycisphaerae bacterium]NIX32270.1 hypothetical protein [Phycisphaerae bacterium]